MQNFLTTLGLGISTILITIGSWFHPIVIKEPTVLLGGTFSVGQAQKFTLSGSGITSSATSIGLSSFKFPDTKTAITLSTLNTDTIFGTLEPGTSKEEQISCTAVAQNGDGSATLSSCSRGLSFYYPYAASTTLSYSHAGAAVFVMSNPAAFYNKFGILANAQTWAGVNTFTSTAQPVYDVAPSFTNSLSLVDKQYVDSAAFQGVATATENTIASKPGAVMLALQSDAANGVASSSSGAPLVLKSGYVRTAYKGGEANVLVDTGSTNTIDANFIATSSQYNWKGAQGFGTTTPSATLGVQGGAFVSGTTTTGGLVATSSVSITNNLSISGTCTGCAASVQSYIPRMVGAATTTSTTENPAAGATYFASEFEIPFTQTFSKISYDVVAAPSAAAGLDMKIFAENGSTLVLATTTGDSTVLGVNTVTASSTFTLAPGIYWMAFSVHPGGALSFATWDYSPNPLVQLNNVSGKNRVSCSYTQAISQFVLPGSVDTTGCSAGTAGLLFRLDK